ncbi:MAG TPA: iron ABC transporter permease [Ramlibacter sp.]|nr:iron ABC transporter permease [Ramlibacter sp.]
MTGRGHAPASLAAALAAASALLLAVGVAVGSMGWEPLLDETGAGLTILWEIRLPRTLGAWAAGALLGMAGAVAQGLFRNPLADPYLLGSATGGAFGVAVLLMVLGAAPSTIAGWGARVGLTGAAFLGALLAVSLTLVLARGVQQTARLLLAGVIVGMVFGALAALAMFLQPELLRTMQAFLLGTTGFLGWQSTALLALVLVAAGLLAVLFSRALDALALGETTASSLGVAVGPVRLVLVAAMALATGAAVAHVGLVAFIGLMAPHLVRALSKPTYRGLIPLSALAGGVLLLAADILARWLLAPREMPVGVVTAILGGVYLLALMQRRRL